MPGLRAQAVLNSSAIFIRATPVQYHLQKAVTQPAPPLYQVTPAGKPGKTNSMILFFFLLLMLAMAWGVADHFQDLATKSPPPERPASKVEAPAPPLPAVLPPVIANNDPPVESKPAEGASPNETDTPQQGSTDTPAEKP